MSSTRFLPPTIHGVRDYAAAAEPTRPPAWLRISNALSSRDAGVPI